MAFIKMLPKVEKKKWIIKAGIEQVPVKYSLNVYSKDVMPEGYLRVDNTGAGSTYLVYDLPIDFRKYTKMVVVGWGRYSFNFARGNGSTGLMHGTERKEFPVNRGSFTDPITLESVFVNPSTNQPDYKYPAFYNYQTGQYFYIIDAWIE